MIHCIVDCRITEKEFASLSRLGVNALLCPKHNSLYYAISSHPDIQIFILNKDHLIIQKDLDKFLESSLHNIGKKLTYSEMSIGCKYPHDIILNCLILGDLFIHNLNYTDSKILSSLGSHVKKLHVKQGYTKCSTAIVSERAIITSDIGIAKALSDEKVDVLYVPPGDIILESMNYGFIGGCCGLLDERNIVFFGSLDKYAYGKEVKEFLKKHRVDYHCLMDEKLTDRGSLLVL